MKPQKLITLATTAVGALTMQAFGQVAYIGAYAAPSIDIVDLGTQNVIGSFATAGGAEGISVSPDGSRVYFSGSGHVMVFDTTTMTALADLTPGGSVGAPLAHPNGDIVYIGLGSGAALRVLDTGTNTFVDTIAMPTNTSYMAFNSDASTLWAGNTNYGTGVFGLTPVDTATNTAGTTITMPSAVAELAVSPDDSRVYISGEPANKVYVVDTSTHTIVNQINMPGGPRGIVFTADGSTAYVANYTSGSIAVVDVATSTMIDEWDVGGLPFRIALSEDEQTAYVPNYGTNTVQVVDIASGMITSNISVSSGPVSIEFAPSTTVPCLADLTGDGALDFFDLSMFLNAFGSNDPIADFTGDGLFDFFDISGYLNAFTAGCP